MRAAGVRDLRFACTAHGARSHDARHMGAHETKWARRHSAPRTCKHTPAVQAASAAFACRPQACLKELERPDLPTAELSSTCDRMAGIIRKARIPDSIIAQVRSRGKEGSAAVQSAPSCLLLAMLA